MREQQMHSVLWDGKPEELRCWETVLNAVTFYVCRNGRGSWT